MIGVIGRYEDGYIKIPSNISKIIYENDMIPIVLIPPNENYDYKLKKDEKNKINKIFKVLDGIILPGGTKWSSMDSYIVKKCIECDKCLLCICMGHQLLGLCDNEIVDENVIENTSNILHNTKNKFAHNIYIKKGTLLHKIIGLDTMCVNSRHNYHIKNKIGIVNAYSPDGYIEAINIENKKFILGVQFHPEDLYDDVNNKKIFDYFFSMCKK